MNYDIVIAGAGPAGIGAALEAARSGLRVALIERYGCVGGNLTQGYVGPLLGKVCAGTVAEEIEAAICAKRGAVPDFEKAKIALTDMLDRAGVDVFLQTSVVGAEKIGDRIEKIHTAGKFGNISVSAETFVDATGDGDVAASAGVPFFKGREEDARMQPCTIMFNVGGVDCERAVFPPSFETLVETPKGELQALAKEILPFPAGHVLLYRQPLPNTVCCNMTNAIEIDGTDGESLTKGIMVCRSQIIPIIKFLREYVPGYEKCYLTSSASLIGIRETRHFEGLATLTKDDILEARVHDDWVVRRAWFNFDVHNLTGASLDKTGAQKHFKQKSDYTIPYGCILPKNVEGLLLSGRNISGSHMAHSNFRIMSVCIALGEAAGTAAALSVKQNIKLRDVNVKEIQEIVGV